MLFKLNLIVPVMIFWKMFADEVQKLSANVCLYGHAVGWIEPNYISSSVLEAINLYDVSCWFPEFSVR